MAVKLTLLLLAAQANVNLSNLFNASLCADVLKCECNQTESYFHMYCPHADSNMRIGMDYRVFRDNGAAIGAFKNLYIKCDNPATFNFKIFPKVNMDIRGIEFHNCSIPENYNFAPILAHFGFNATKSFEAYNIGITQLDGQIFHGLSTLSELRLSYNEISVLRENVFHSLVKLDALTLSHNKLEFLEEGIFTQQKKLTLLDLSNNELICLTKEMFTGLSSLRHLSLKKNNFERLSSDVFRNIPELLSMTFGNTNIKYAISDNIFASQLISLDLERVIIPIGFQFNITHIQNFDITESEFGCNLTNFTDIITLRRRNYHPFANLSASITQLNLKRNGLTHGCDGLFDNLNELKRLYLSFNNLTVISKFIFEEAYNLEVVFIDHNRISTIHSNAFANTKQLFLLDLSYNHITTIHSDTFANTKQLKTIDVSYNQLSFSKNQSPFLSLYELSKLYLHNNNLTAIPFNLKNIKKLSLLYLGFNNISSFKFGDLHHAVIHYAQPKSRYFADESDLLQVFLNDNPLKCDYSLTNILRNKGYLHDALANHVDRMCNKILISGEVLMDGCPSQCLCPKRHKNGLTLLTITECSGRGLVTVPSIEHINSNLIDLSIGRNKITELPNFQSNVFLIIIRAENNNIQNIKLENLPPNLRALDLSHNKIQRISANVVNALINLENFEMIFLSYNPWRCDCTVDTLKFTEFVKENISMTDLRDSKCHLSGVDYDFSSDVFSEICSRENKIITLILVSVLSTLIGIVVILFYKYQQFIKIWLYAHNVCLWCVDEYELDKDKTFDAFISYSHLDEDFAISLVYELENSSPNFKLCVHERDWMPGQLIAQSIVQSMENSCRTIIILSKHFLESVWGLHEFHCAYASSLAEKRMRLIIVLYGDIGEIDLLDPTIQTYLKAHTYVKWGDPWFWQKIRYALPHRNRN